MSELCMSGTDRYQSTSSLSPVGRARRIKAVPGPFLLGRVNQPGIGIIHHTYCLVHTTKVGIIHHTAWFILQSWNYSSYCLVHTTKLELFIILPCFYYCTKLELFIIYCHAHPTKFELFIILPSSYYKVGIIHHSALFILQSWNYSSYTASFILQSWNYSSYCLVHTTYKVGIIHHTAWFILQSWNYSSYNMLPCSYYKV